jgi:hypothetical protein
MPITVACPSCRKTLKAPDTAAGRKVKCPGCGTALAIPALQKDPTPFDDLSVPTSATSRPRAKTPNRTILFAAVGGGVLAVLLLAVVLVLVLKSGGSKSSVEVSVNWKTANGVEFDDNPVAVLIPKGMKEKIDQFAPIYAGEDYEKAFSKDFRKCGAYLAVGVGGKAWFENVPRGSYTLIVFPNSFMGTIDEGIGEDEARRAEQQLQPFFTRVRLDFLRKKPVLIRDIEVKDSVVDVRHEFPKRTKLSKGAEGNAGGAEKLSKPPVVQNPKDTVAEEVRREERRKEVERAIQDAEPLQAPAIVKGQINNALPFAQQMWDLATNEFKLQAAKGKVFRSRFDQKDQAAVLKWFFARNSFVGPGKYDFKTGEYTLDPVLWQEYYAESEALGKLRPETTDSCVLLMQFKVDAATAEQWRAKMEKKAFALTVWYRLKEVKRAARKENPHWTDGRLAYDIAFVADVLKFEESAEEAPAQPQPKVEEGKPAPKQEATPRSIADNYMKSLEKKGLIRGPVHAGLYKNPKGNDSYAVAYKVSSVNGRTVLGDTVHLYVFKDKQGDWRISAFSQDGVHVMLGPPPRGFQPVPDPGKKE